MNFKDTLKKLGHYYLMGLDAGAGVAPGSAAPQAYTVLKEAARLEDEGKPEEADKLKEALLTTSLTWSALGASVPAWIAAPTTMVLTTGLGASGSFANNAAIHAIWPQYSGFGDALKKNLGGYESAWEMLNPGGWLAGGLGKGVGNKVEPFISAYKSSPKGMMQVYKTKQAGGRTKEIADLFKRLEDPRATFTKQELNAINYYKNKDDAKEIGLITDFLDRNNVQGDKNSHLYTAKGLSDLAANAQDLPETTFPGLDSYGDVYDLAYFGLSPEEAVRLSVFDANRVAPGRYFDLTYDGALSTDSYPLALMQMIRGQKAGKGKIMVKELSDGTPLMQRLNGYGRYNGRDLRKPASKKTLLDKLKDFLRLHTDTKLPGDQHGYARINKMIGEASQAAGVETIPMYESFNPGNLMESHLYVPAFYFLKYKNGGKLDRLKQFISK